MICTYVHTNSILHTIFSLLADPFVISHPDLPIDAALGENFKMMFVVGINSNGTTNGVHGISSIILISFIFNESTILDNKITYPNLPYTVQYQIPISTASEGNYTFSVCKSATLLHNCVAYYV